ncbi:MAG: methyltransferase domain-containing protein [Desulfobacterales bacterium]|nr:methyltransferase domain-containing protein [Desulfobacterales bacterium]
MTHYVHGYSKRETTRLQAQADTLVDIIHGEAIFPPGSRILEPGCGTGAQTLTLAANNPDSSLTSMDISDQSIEKARKRVAHLSNVTFQKGDIYNLPFEDEHFDHVFVCFVLEHLKEPEMALAEMRRVLVEGGSITVVEGDHGSFYCHPQSEAVKQAVDCLVKSQALAGGNSLVGRELYPLLKKAGFQSPVVTPKMVYVDASRPDLVEGFSKNTFTAMIEGVRKKALELNLIDEATWEAGIRDLYRATEEDGTFCYTFFRGTAVKDMSPASNKLPVP